MRGKRSVALEVEGAAAAAGRRIAGTLAVLILAHALASPAQAAIFVVTNTNDSGAGSLRQAILDANVAMGPDEITFSLAGCPCTVMLASALVVTDDLTITGPGTASLALDGGDLIQVLRATPPATGFAISDLTVRNGRDPASGGGIFSTAPLTLTDVRVQSSSAGFGGGIYAGADATLVDCVVEDNVASTTHGGGLYAGGALNVSGSRFEDNQTTAHNGYGGGGGVFSLGPATISDTDFVGNTTGDWGGAAYVYDGPELGTVFSDVRLIGNTAEDGGGGGLFVWHAAELTGVEAVGNYAGYRGGAIYGSYAGNWGLTVTGGSLLNNSAAGGGGLYADGDIVVDGTVMTANLSRNGNGGAMWTPSSAVVSNVSVSSNVVVKGGNSGGIDTGANLTLTDSTLSENRTYTGAGGGSGSGGNATITGCEYVGNTAMAYGGGALAFGTATVSNSRFSGNTSDSVGGGVAAFQGAEVSASEFEGNTAQANWGGGLFAQPTGLVTDTLFSGNTSRYAGGGLAVAIDAATVTGGRFEGNTAGPGGWGGAIYAPGTSLEVDGTEFVSNTGEGSGGAIRAAGSVSVNGAVFQGNVSAGYGGALYASSDLEVLRSKFIDNEGDRGGAVFQNSGSGQIENSLFVRNQALSGLGMALALKPSALQSVRHATIVHYPGQAAGSALYVDGGIVELRNSIVTSHATGLFQNAGTATAEFNLFDGNGADVQGAAAANNDPVAGSPDFLDPANDDYHLTLGSAALDAGPDVGAVADIDGELRPQGGGFDLGFDELDLGLPTACPVGPAPLCSVAASDALQVKMGSVAAKNRFTLKHLRAAGPLSQADFGDPVTGGNVYQLCFYDASAGSPLLVGKMTVPGGGSCGGKPCWKAIASKGFVFKDKAATHDGVKQVVLKAGEAGKGAILVAGAGAGLALPGPKASGIPYLDADPGVTVQIHESSTGNCWESHVDSADVQKNTEEQFKALRK